jgi:hypothetical protein
MNDNRLRLGLKQGQERLHAAWQVLKQRTAKRLSPDLLKTALILGASLILCWGLQFFTRLFEAAWWLAIAAALFNAALAIRLATGIFLKDRMDALQGVLGVLAVAVAGFSLWSIGLRMSYLHTLDGDAFYSLPHAPTPLPAGATTISLTTQDNVHLLGSFLAGGHARGLLIYPTWRTNRRAFALLALAQWLSNGYDVLILDPRGQGDSGGTKTPDGQAKYDVIAGVSYLKSLAHSRVGVLAEQEGVYPALLAADMHAGIDALALAAPVEHWGASLAPSGAWSDPSTLTGRLIWRIAAGLRLDGGPPGVSPLEAAGMVAPTPVLFCGPLSPPGSTLDQFQAAAREPKSLIVLGGQGAPVDWGHFADYYEALKQWFDLTLRSPL